jgi:NAD(P)-dependent dehydrogenase (short-subunit alcohol dehydrogenase family)
MADAVVFDASKLGSSAVAIQADLTDDTGPETIVKKTLDAFNTSHIDILVNNAGVTDVQAVEDVTRKSFDAVFAVNARAVFFMSQAVLPHIRKGGRIINISSTGARTGIPSTAVYSSSKAAVEAFTRVMAAEFGPKYGINVTAVNPGPVATDMYLSVPEDLKKGLEEIVKATPAEARMGTPEDIADIVGFLASEQSRWITGNVVTANGGLLMM